MPGANCAFFGCFSSGKKKGIALFKIPVVSASDGEHSKALKTKAREEWLRLITRTGEMTPDLKRQIDASTIHLCELHFKPECITVRK